MLKMAEPIIHHRNPEFNEVLTRVNQNLKYLFQTEQPVLTSRVQERGRRMDIRQSLLAGRYDRFRQRRKIGEHWVKMPKAYGLNVIEIKVEWGKAPTGQQILDALKAHPETKAVYLTHSETSTGTATE